MKKIVLILIGSLFLAALLSSCQDYRSSASYFNGGVLGEYYQTLSHNQDSFTLTFYEKGEYQVHFSLTPGTESRSFNRKWAMTIPEDFTINITDSPRVKVINEWILPGFLRVTITHNGKVEYHDFK